MNSNKIFLYCCFSTAVLISACKKNSNNENSLTTTDKTFMTQAAYSNLNEVDAGKLAVTNGQNDSVRIFGMMMMTDHQKAYTSLDSIASINGVTIPTVIDAEHVALRQRLTGLSGREFDTAYMNSQVKDHLKTINLFQTEQTNGSYQGVRDYTTKLLPNIQMHYMMADRLSKKL